MRPVWATIALALVLGSCTSRDWIDRTLVTSDVTSVWQGRWVRSGGVGTGDVEFAPSAAGPKVTGTVELPTGGASIPGMSSDGIPIEGSVSGDTFTFHELRGQKMQGEFQVNGDEMSWSWVRLIMQKATLRRQP